MLRLTFGLSVIPGDPALEISRKIFLDTVYQMKACGMISVGFAASFWDL
jgi:hypothetical protein